MRLAENDEFETYDSISKISSIFKINMKTSVAPTPKLPYSAPLGGNPQPLALNDSPVNTIDYVQTF